MIAKLNEWLNCSIKDCMSELLLTKYASSQLHPLWTTSSLSEPFLRASSSELPTSSLSFFCSDLYLYRAAFFLKMYCRWSICSDFLPAFILLLGLGAVVFVATISCCHMLPVSGFLTTTSTRYPTLLRPTSMVWKWSMWIRTRVPWPAHPLVDATIPWQCEIPWFSHRDTVPYHVLACLHSTTLPSGSLSWQ